MPTKNKLKIGVLTFQNADNYGAVLQAYALKQVLQSLDFEVDVINYNCPAIYQAYRLFSKIDIKSVDFLKRLIKWPFWLHRHMKFEYFRRKYLTIDTPLLSAAQVSALASKYDYFITGSDQVFNLRMTQFDSTYFLPFADSEKSLSYAASFGISLEQMDAKELQFFKKHLKHFGKLSLREGEGERIVNNIINQHAQVHIDPTLLLTSGQWKELIRSDFSEPYILLYLMSKDEKLISFARELSKQKGYRIVNIPSVLKVIPWKHTTHVVPSPRRWLSLFAHASYVVTNSFHGAAFSINFNKKFFLGRLQANGTGSRLAHLMNITGLQDRFYTNSKQNYDSPIDWEKVNRSIESERQKAFGYLRELMK